MYKKQLALGLAIALASVSAQAVEKGEFTLNGFGTLGVTHMGGAASGDSYGAQGQTTDGWRGDAVSRFGLQASYGLTETLSATIQGTAKASGERWEFGPEWAYLSWAPTDKLMLRAGRLRNPVYMYSETLDVSFTYPWLSLPDELYGQVQLSNYEGFDAVYTTPTSLGLMSTQLAIGEAKDRDFIALGTRTKMDYDKILGLSMSLQTNDYGTFRVTYTEADITAQLAGFVDRPAGLGGPGVVSFVDYDDLKGRFTGLGHRYDNGTWLTSAEFSALVVEGDGQREDNAYYVMGGRRIGDFLVHVTHGGLRSGSLNQKSWALGVNYALTPSVNLKSEYKRVNTHGGSEGLFTRDLQETYDSSLYEAGVGGSAPKNRSADVISLGMDFVF